MRKLVTFFGGLAAVTLSAHALSITPTSGVLNTSRYEFSENNQAALNLLVAPIIGSATEVYKQDVGVVGDTGSLAGSYQTTFSNSATDPEDALIDYIGGSSVGPTAWLLVKDGNSNPAAYLFNLTTLGWNGTDDLELTDFWAGAGQLGRGAISHVTLYGPKVSVPDGGATAALLGLGILGLVSFARKR